MCTLTWLESKESYEVFFNRDELNTRAPEMPPEILQERGLRLVAPRDSQAGGTWIGVNESGITLAIMNDYSVTLKNPAEPFESRGLLLFSLLSCESFQQVQDVLAYTRMVRYPPFRLVFFSIGKAVSVFFWNGTELQMQEAGTKDIPLVSASFDQEGAIKKRHEYFNDVLQKSASQMDRKFLMDFHSSQAPQPGPYSVCMKRDDAATRSFCHVTVTQKNATFFYYPDPPVVSPDKGKTVLLQFEKRKRKWSSL